MKTQTVFRNVGVFSSEGSLRIECEGHAYVLPSADPALVDAARRTLARRLVAGSPVGLAFWRAWAATCAAVGLSTPDCFQVR
jgi:hypothetical protein